MTDGFHDYGTAPCAPHRPAPKQEDGTMADVQREQLARLQRLGADPGIASVLLDEHGADTLVALPDDALEALADGKRAADSVDMSTIDSVLGWVYENEDDAVSTVARAQLALTLEEARRTPRRGVLDPLRAYVEDNVETPASSQPRSTSTWPGPPSRRSSPLSETTRSVPGPPSSRSRPVRRAAPARGSWTNSPR
jgi:hypothetical protein